MKTIKIYQFDELSEKAQEKAIQDYIDSEREYSWMDDNIESIKQGLTHFGFSMGNRYRIEYASANRSYVPIEGHDDEVRELSGVRLWKYLTNNHLDYWCKYEKKRKPLLEGNCPFTGYCVDENFLDPIRNFMKKPTDISFIELMEECVYEGLKAIEVDFDYQNSEEYATEELQNRGSDYFEDGREV